jgi:hypothetical protein
MIDGRSILTFELELAKMNSNPVTFPTGSMSRTSLVYLSKGRLISERTTPSNFTTDCKSTSTPAARRNLRRQRFLR